MEDAVCVESYDKLTIILYDHISERLKRWPPPSEARFLRSPVCLLFVRPKADAEEQLQKQAKVSFSYWHYASGSAIDIVLPGWTVGHKFRPDAFAEFEDELRRRTKWRSTGNVTALVLDCVFQPAKKQTDLDFSRVLVLPVGRMIKEQRIDSLDDLIGFLIDAAKNSREDGADGAVWEISDDLAIQAGGKRLWAVLKKVPYIGEAVSVYEGVRDYTICDIRKDA